MLALSSASRPATTTAATAAKPAPLKKRKTFAGPQTRAVTQFSTTWQSLSGTERTTWQTVSQQFAQTNVNGAPSKLSAYLAFIQCNTLLQGAGLPTVRAFSGVTTAPTDWPNLALTGTLSQSSSALVLHAAAAYAPSVIVYAAAPLLGGSHDYSKKIFRRIGSLPGLTVGANALGGLYLARYRIPSEGYEIAIKLVGVMDSGLHTKPFILTAIVTP